jgi:hypothetical protein
MSSQPQVARERACAEKQRRLAAIRRAFDDVFALQTQKRISIESGHSDDLIYILRSFEKAALKWEDAWQACLSHIREHGC